MTHVHRHVHTQQYHHTLHHTPTPQHTHTPTTPNTHTPQQPPTHTHTHTASLKLLAEVFPWQPGSVFAYTQDNHNSVVGMRGPAAAAGATLQCVTVRRNTAVGGVKVDGVGQNRGGDVERSAGDAVGRSRDNAVGENAGGWMSHAGVCAAHEASPGTAANSTTTAPSTNAPSPKTFLFHTVPPSVPATLAEPPPTTHPHPHAASSSSQHSQTVHSIPQYHSNIPCLSSASQHNQPVCSNIPCLFTHPAESNLTGVRYDALLAAHVKKYGVDSGDDDGNGSCGGNGGGGNGGGGDNDSVGGSSGHNAASATAGDLIEPPPATAAAAAAQSQAVNTKVNATGNSQQRRWYVCLDAAKACSTCPPDLQQCNADFVVLSYYKVWLCGMWYVWLTQTHTVLIYTLTQHSLIHKHTLRSTFLYTPPPPPTHTQSTHSHTTGVWLPHWCGCPGGSSCPPPIATQALCRGRHCGSSTGSFSLCEVGVCVVYNGVCVVNNGVCVL